MITGLDHVVVLVHDSSVAAAEYQTLLGRAPAWRSRRDGGETVIFTLANTSIELLAPIAGDPAAERLRAALRERGEGLASMCFRVDDIAKTHRRLDRLSLMPEPIAEAASCDEIGGGELRWRRTRASRAAARGIGMFFLALDGERPASEAVADAPVTGLDHIVVATHDPEGAAALYGARLGLDMALDRSRPDWGRLMFFRCGDLVVEVMQKPGQAEAADDRLYGLSWRVADIDAAHRRLTAAGVDVSGVRNGRKPGTRVMTVRSHSCGVPTLVLQPATPRRL